jgi:cell division protein FtsI/penicillin-binding protein 2
MEGGTPSGVRLTIDDRMQRIVESELDRGMSEFKARRGTVIVMEPDTGAVFAMASQPHFNLDSREAVDGVTVAGKTGTARKKNPEGRGYLADSYVTSFAGMLPAAEPEFVCVVVIDDPTTTEVARYGGSIAAPVFSRIADRITKLQDAR